MNAWPFPPTGPGGFGGPGRAFLRRVRCRRRGAAGAARAERMPPLIGVPDGLPAIERHLVRQGVLVIGCGAVGQVAAAALARFQPARIVCVDPKSASSTSVLTGLRFTPGDAGIGKALKAARDAADVAPRSEVFAFAGPAQALPLSVWLAADTVVLAADNLNAEAFVGEVCHRLGLPLIVANVHGASLVAQVRVFGNAGAESPCPACAFSQEEWRLAEAETRYSCAGDEAVWPGQAAAPTLATAHLCALAGLLGVNQWLRFVLHQGPPLADTLLEFCGFGRLVALPLVRRPGCRCDHTRWERVALGQHPARLSLDALAAAAGFSADRRTLWLSVDGKEFMETGHCRCLGGQGRPVHRFLSFDANGVAEWSCPECTGPVRVTPFHRHSRLSARVLGGACSWPLRRLGVQLGDVVFIGDGDRTVVFMPVPRAAEPSAGSAAANAEEAAP